MKNLTLLLFLSGVALAAQPADVAAYLRKAGLPISQKNGIQWATVTVPASGEQVAVGFYGDDSQGKVSKSVSLVYEGFSFDGGMYGLGYLMAALNGLCFNEKIEGSEDAGVFVQNAVQQGLSNGSGTFAKTFDGLRYVVKADHYVTGRIQVRLTTSTSVPNRSRCRF